MKKQWMLRQSGINTKLLANKTGISEIIINILANRGIKDPWEISKFLNPSLEDLYSGYLMRDMEKGIDIIKASIEEGKKIVIYGDYDVDGVMSTYILYKTLIDCGARVSYHIPDREKEGYGMNSERIKMLKEEGFEVILTCDNGISALEQVKLAKELGFQVVITDHHDVPFVEKEDGSREFKLPNADAIINPKQSDCFYPFKSLCGGGIAFKFAQCLYEAFSLDESKALEFIEYAAIATICDVVDLVDENRVIVKNGLEKINNTKNLGLRALLKVNGLEDKKISTYHIGFILGPCINATGRLESASISVKLLLSEDEESALNLASELKRLNVERQEMTSASVEETIEYIEKNCMDKDKVIVVYNENIHESIAGIVAGRIKERYNSPTIILTKGSEMPKGSARSIEGYNIFEELLKCKELLHKFGGHPMAAGLSLKMENIQLLRETLIKNCSLQEEDYIPKIRIDKQLPLKDISFSFVNELELLEPFGKGNATPIFAEKSVEVFKASFIGKEGNVLKMNCRIKGTYLKMDAISFEHCEEFKNMVIEKYGERFLRELTSGGTVLPVDLIFYPDINEYNGNRNIQLVVKDIRI